MKATTRPTTTTRAVLLALCFAAGVRAAANLCFFPGGVQARDVPCDPTAEVSMCCGSAGACLSNGLCRLEDTSNSTGIAYARGTCSDPTWQSPVCPQNCVLNPDTRTNKTAYDFRFNGVQVWQCDSQGFGVPGKFCCESAAEKARCCSTPAAVFGPLIAATPGNAAAVQTYHASSSAGSTRTATRAAGAATSAPAETAAASGVPATPGQADVGSSPSPTGGSSDGGGGGGGGGDSGGRGGQGGLGNAAIVGMGVGASMGGALLVAVGVMWWLRKERRQQGKAAELDAASTYTTTTAGGGGGNLSRSDTKRTYDGAGAYVAAGKPASAAGRASSDWEAGKAVGHHHEVVEIDGREAAVVAVPRAQARVKSMYEMP